VRLLREANQEYKESPGSSVLLTLAVTWGPVILIAVLLYLFVFRSIRGAGGGPGGMLGNFGRSKHKLLNKEHSTVTIDDVAGIDEAKDEVNEIVEFLRNPKKFQRLGGRVPRGVLLDGHPGCGKTLLAKAMAGEAEVPFFSISGSDFVEMFVGVGASRVRDLFKQAKESSPCIIFLDEIDAVGRRRGSGFSSGGHDEREQTLNAILVEMDGFETNDQVIVVAATNRADVLDPALTRPGRFDRQIHVPLPDLKGRVEILKVHSRKIKLGPDVNMEKIARGTPMFSGADLAAMINESAISATLSGKDFVEQDDLEEARDKIRWGRARKSQKLEEEERKVIAYHEAGHAVIMYYDKHSDPLHKVTIIPRGPSLGATYLLPEKDRNLSSRNQLLARMRSSFGGRIAEFMFCGDMYNGTAGDIRMATSIARSMVTQYGMSDKLGFQFIGDDEHRQPGDRGDTLSNETAQIIDVEVKELIDNTYNQATQILEEHRDQVEALAKALLKYETLSFDEVEKLMKGEDLDKPTVAELLQTEQDKITNAQESDDQKPQANLGDDTPDSPSIPSPA
jgi:cell division protease FtsH